MEFELIRREDKHIHNIDYDENHWIVDKHNEIFSLKV